MPWVTLWNIRVPPLHPSLSPAANRFENWFWLFFFSPIFINFLQIFFKILYRRSMIATACRRNSTSTSVTSRFALVRSFPLLLILPTLPTCLLHQFTSQIQRFHKHVPSSTRSPSDRQLIPIYVSKPIEILLIIIKIIVVPGGAACTHIVYVFMFNFYLQFFLKNIFNIT